jgi:hypothetical protein
MLMKGKVAYEPISGDSLFTVPQFDFYFKVVIPKANKERLIVERNSLGQIIRSEVPLHYLNL